MLVESLTAREVAAARGLQGQLWEKFFHMRLREFLSTLALVFGFSTTAAWPRSSPTATGRP
jgi:hypothetical protein